MAPRVPASAVLPALLLLWGCSPTKVDDTGPGEGVCDEAWFLDADGDGYGRADTSVTGCTAPEGYVADATDCDDFRAETNPGAAETCNGVDDDCDGAVDADATDAETWYADTDGDRQGDPGAGVEACAQPEGTVGQPTDCDDTDADTFMGAAQAENFEACMKDTDGDGWGDATPPDGVTPGTDCDDANPEQNPGMADTPYDGFDADCSGSDYDADGDGHDSAAYEGDDCDDADPAVHPGALDYPSDGVDSDCDGVELEGDYVEVAEGETGEATLEVDHSLVLDVGLVLDSTGSLSWTWYYLSSKVVLAEVAEVSGDACVGLAAYADYRYAGYGVSSDLPYLLIQPVTADADLFAAAVDALPYWSGSDAPESTMEALYQAATGAGYDEDCDGTLDPDDVLPFLASADDPFGGLEGQSYDEALAPCGTLGGMGFREVSNRVIAYVTDNTLRDPDAGSGTPGGCPMDAGSEDVAAAVLDLDARLVGVASSYATPGAYYDQMEDLATATDSLGDTDGDGVHDDLLVDYEYGADDLMETLGDLLDAMVPDTFSEVTVTVLADEAGVVSAVTPSSFTEVAANGTLEITLALDATAVDAGDEGGVLLPIRLLVLGDGEWILAVVDLYVAVPSA